jgi:hypothetical protein
VKLEAAKEAVRKLAGDNGSSSSENTVGNYLALLVCVDNSTFCRQCLDRKALY